MQAEQQSERTPQDYAIEHAEYMARGAEDLLNAINAEDELRVRREESDEVTEDEVYDAGCDRGEMMRVLKSAIYEFRKRRDSAALSHPSTDDRMTHEYRKGFIDGQIDMRDRPEEQGEPWLSIDCAPKNGSPIILGRAPDEYDKDGFAGQGRWYEAEEDCPDQMGHDAGFMDDRFAYFRFSRHFGKPSSLTQGLQPTHWMHLPPPPEQGSKG